MDTKQNFYRYSECTAKKVLACLKVDPKTDSEWEFLKYLHILVDLRYNSGFHITFLRFATGANIVSNKSKLLASLKKMRNFGQYHAHADHLLN